jgi:hypothetical protein
MDARQQHIAYLKSAERQFRLACAVNMATTCEAQSLDVPMEWTFGRHRISYRELALDQAEAEHAAAGLEHTTTFVMAVTIREALRACVPNAAHHEDSAIVSAHQIARMIRNAFAYQMMAPRWSIDQDCRDRLFEVAEIIRLDTEGLNGKPFDWRDYGGPLALFRLSQHVRRTILEDESKDERIEPGDPQLECYQQGRLMLRKIG